eukprot:TRINITY_DN29298_c0_g1_i1.p1 TRINITY_DN29298_c0_g1~~TRINITY_DN29298_c0_g1_i1.p1  ORF type:complete len:280 (+),score=28.71 TRINITY_DN29298_c0_g1_i1:337-1176(+)
MIKPPLQCLLGLPAKTSCSLLLKGPCRIPHAKRAGGTDTDDAFVHLKSSRFPASSLVFISSRSSHSSNSITCRSTLESECKRVELPSERRVRALEEGIEKAIYGFRFMTFLGVWGSLLGSLLCFLKGCVYVVGAFTEYYMRGGKVIVMLFEAIDIYLLGTVMLVFGMGLYELFISNLDIAQTHELSHPTEKAAYRSNLFGLFTLMERPRWLEIQSINELKTKLGHVIVTVLLVGLFEKSKKVVMCYSTDLLCFSAAILLSSGGLYLLSKLNIDKRNKKA